MTIRKTGPDAFQSFIAILCGIGASICFCINIAPFGVPFFGRVKLWVHHVPWFLVAIALLLYPAHIVEVSWRSWRMRLRIAQARKRGAVLCEVCGYDRRATPERCPECGATPQRMVG